MYISSGSIKPIGINLTLDGRKSFVILLITNVVNVGYHGFVADKLIEEISIGKSIDINVAIIIE
jgi:hypothetical protein